MNFSIFSSRLKARTWFRLALCGVLAIVAGLVLLNLVVDPYDYFGVGPFDRQVQTNERVWKTNYLAAHHKDYDSFIFGSSIASQIDPGLAGELTGGRFYNLTMSGANTYDFELFLDHMLRNRYPVRRALLIWDMSVFWSYGESGREYERNHPTVSGDSVVEFYASYLTRIHFWGTVDKVRLNLGEIPESPHTSYDLRTGVYRYGHRMALIRADEEKFLRESRTLNENFLLRTKRPREPFDSAMRSLDRILATCREHDIELTVVIPPHNYNYMNRILFDEYAMYLRALAERTPFWNFSGYGDVNLDNHNYFDSMHFRPGVGDRILRVIYGGLSDPEFGTRVTKNDVEALLERKRAEFDHADSLFPTHAEKVRQGS